MRALRRLKPLRLTQVLAACASSTMALGIASRWLEAGDVELAIAGGYDALNVFVAAGFEHSIANLYLLPYALMINAWAGPEFWAAVGQDAVGSALTVSGVLHNIAVSTIGNLVGGSLLVGHGTPRTRRALRTLVRWCGRCAGAGRPGGHRARARR